MKPPEYRPPAKTAYTNVGWVYAALTAPVHTDAFVAKPISKDAARRIAANIVKRVDVRKRSWGSRPKFSAP